MASEDELSGDIGHAGERDTPDVPGSGPAGHDRTPDLGGLKDFKDSVLGAVFGTRAPQRRGLFFAEFCHLGHFGKAGDAGAAVDAPFFNEDDFAGQGSLIEGDAVHHFGELDIGDGRVREFWLGFFFLCERESRKGSAAEEKERLFKVLVFSINQPIVCATGG